MTSSVFVDGICEIDDLKVRSHFQTFGSKISGFRILRRQSTHSCCFALITFTSPHTAGAVMKYRPHRINNYPVFVKRLHPGHGTNPPVEQEVPITRLVFTKSKGQEMKEQSLKNLFQQFGSMKLFEFCREENRIVVEYEDYDSTDRLLIANDFHLWGVEFERKSLTDAVVSRPYFGICHRKAEVNVQPVKISPPKLHLPRQNEVIVKKNSDELVQLRLLITQKDEELCLLRKENAALQKKIAELEKKPPQWSCSACQQHQATIVRLKNGIVELNDSYEKLLTSRPDQPIDLCEVPSNQNRKLRLSTRLNVDESKLNSVVARFPLRRNDSSVLTSNSNEISQQRPLTPLNRVRYKYEPVTNGDETN